MPCYDGRDYEDASRARDEIATLKKQIEWRDAVICATYTQISNMRLYAQVMGGIDWKEAGVRRSDFSMYQVKHREADIARKAREQAEKEAKKALNELTRRRAALLAAMSPEDKILLGLA